MATPSTEVLREEGIEVLGKASDISSEILTPEALKFLSKLHRKFESRRQELLQRRVARQQEIDDGKMPDFLPETKSIREREWTVAPIPKDLEDRRVEITGPVDRKMIINALNSGANVYMADFEDSNSPTWQNNMEGQFNLRDAVRGVISYTSPEGKSYKLGPKLATLLVRPRGWHLVEKHLRVDGQPISGSLFDFGLFFFHNAEERLKRGTGVYLYLPKMESHLEARLWNDVFNAAQDALGIPRGSVRATVLIETIPAAFEMEEILYELRDHAGGLNAGRWDYIFSIIKKFRNRPDFLFPDRAQVTMAVPFIRAYTQLLVKTCHRRGAHAIGGMAAFIPSRRDPKVNEVALAKVREDKVREAGDGFDGTWVAHPDLVSTATECFDAVLGERANQIDRLREDVRVTGTQLVDTTVPGGRITEAGLRQNVSVGIQYIESWLRGVGAAAIFNLMEDAATAEISRSQVWQWVRHRARLAEGPEVTAELVRQVEEEELGKIRDLHGRELYGRGRFEEAREVFHQVATSEEFVDFLTLPAYQLID